MNAIAKTAILLSVVLSMFVSPPVVHTFPLHPQELVSYERYDWVDETWIHYAASIVAGETVHDCTECDLWIACTIVRDVVHRGYHRYNLHPGRWHGYKCPKLRHYEAITQAIRGRECAGVPVCRYLGNDGDYRYWCSIGLVGDKEVRVIGGSRSSIYCIPNW